MVSLQNGSKQDLFVQGQVGDMHYLGVMDGHGGSSCINFLRSLDFDFIASQPDPAQTVWDLTKKGFHWSGATFTFARITDVIEVWNIGDSLTQVFLNDQIYTSDIHTFLNPKEVERTQSLMERLEHTTAPHPVSETHIQDMPSIVGHFKAGDKIVPSMCLGHNGCTGFAAHYRRIPFKSTDQIRIVCVSDGVTDMQVDLSKGSAMDIAHEAERKWNQTWIYKGYPLKFAAGDDISCVVWENVVELPSLCIPYAPAFFTTEDVRTTLDMLLNIPIRKIVEVDIKDHKAFFVHLNPCVLLPTSRKMYSKLLENQPVKIWVRESWFWHIRLSNPPTQIQTVGWQYKRWDGTGDYFEFAKEQIHDRTATQLTQFFQQF
jgi:serine/threonine protein phosphatase PrpC